MDELEKGVVFATNYPNIFIGVVIGFVIAYFLMEKGIISVPSVNKQITELRTENVRLTTEVSIMKDSFEEAQDFQQFKTLLVQKEIDRMSSGIKKANG